MNKKIIVPVAAAAAVFGLIYIYREQLEQLADEAIDLGKGRIDQIKDIQMKDVVKEVIGKVVTGTPVLDALKETVGEAVSKAVSQPLPAKGTMGAIHTEPLKATAEGQTNRMVVKTPAEKAQEEKDKGAAVV